MTIRLYDDTTHQVVPKEPTEKMFVSVDAVNDAERERLAKSGSSVTQASWMKTHSAAYQAMLAAALAHGVALPTREEIAYALAKVQGYDKPLPHTHYEQADAILALIQEKMQGKEGG